MGGFLGLLVFGAFIAGLFVVFRTLSLPREVRELRERLEAAERRLQTVARRVDAVVDKAGGAHQPGDPYAKSKYPRDASSPPLTDIETDIEVPPAVSQLVRGAWEAETAAAKTEFAASLQPPPLPIHNAQEEAARPIVPVENTFDRWVKSLGPKDKNMTWEMALGTYWLPRLGALAVTTAIVFLLTLAFQKWGPPVRVAVGYAAAAALLGGGWRFDRKYPTYARVLYGAGFALSYFVTFSTYFVKFAKILDTPYLSLAGLAAIVLVWAALAQRRRSPVIAGVAVAMGHFTIALATYSIASPGAYSVAGIVFLSAGGAFFLARNGWYAVAALGLAASYTNHFYLMTKIKTTGTPAEFAVGMGILCTYFLVYAGAELGAPEEIRRKRMPLWFRNGFVTLNSVSLFLLGTISMYSYDFAKNEREIFYYALGAVLLAISIAYLRLRAGDPLYNAYFAKGISAATIGLATQFDAHTLTTSFAIESAVLMLAARRNGLLVTRILALAAGILTFVQGARVIIEGNFPAYADPSYWPQAAQALGALAGLLIAAEIYRRTDWTPANPAGAFLSADTRLLLWNLDLIAEPPAQKPKLAGGELVPFILCAMAGVLAIGYSAQLTLAHDFALVLSAAALFMTLAAAGLGSAPCGLPALMFDGTCMVFASARYWMKALGERGVLDAGSASERGIPMLACLALVALASEERYMRAFRGLRLHQLRWMPALLYGVVAWLLGHYLSDTAASPAWTVAALLIAAATFAAAAIPLHRQTLAWCATGLLAWAALRWIVDWDRAPTNGFLAVAWIGVATGVVFERYLSRLGQRYAASVSMCVAAALFAVFVFDESPHEWIALWWALGGAAFAVHGGILRTRTSGVLGVGTITAASIYQAAYTQDHHPIAWAIVAGFAVPAACWVAIERAAKNFSGSVETEARRPLVQGAAAALATALLVLMLYRLPQLAEYYLTISWSVLGMAMFGLAIGLREKYYRYCGLAVLALASLRVAIVDTRELETVEKVMAWGVLGIVLLALGYGYVRVFARNERDQVSPSEGK